MKYKDDVSEDLEVKDEELEDMDDDSGGKKGANGMGNVRDEGIKGDRGNVSVGVKKGSEIKGFKDINRASAKENV
nr:hypothetical protein [Tanacetum cinerariifolium]